MNIKHIPVLIIGVMFTLVGLSIAFAPDVFVYTPRNAIYLETLGRMPTGLVTISVGLLTMWEGWRGSKSLYGLYAAFLLCLFFAGVTLLPLWFGDSLVQFGPFTFRGFVNAVSVIVWAMMSVLVGYIYISIKLDK